MNLRESAAMALTVRPLSPVLGAEVIGLDLERDLSDAAFGEILEAWRRHLVLVFRGQTIGDERLLAFARRFGELDPAPKLDGRRSHPPGFPEITVVSNVVENGEPVGGLANGELGWHSDMTYQPNPPVGCVLHAWEAPEDSGFTWFSSLREALATLPAGLRDRLRTLSAVHDETYTSAGTVRQGHVGHAGPQHAKGATHPFFVTHPSWGEEILLAGRRKNALIPGLPLTESEALLDELWAHLSRPELAIKHAWRPGDVVVWDNLLTLHKRDAFDSSARRTLHRAQIRRLHPALQAAA
jgi:taurine dioxygenase